MIRTAKVDYGGAGGEGAEDARVQWLGQTILRRHSFLSVAKQIAAHQRNNDVTRVGVQGVEGSGKTTVAHLLAHQVHVELAKMSAEKDLPETTKQIMASGYTVHFLGDAELVDFDATLAALPRNNRILWFDDVSFLRGGGVSRQQIEHMKQAMTIIRHLDGGEDVRTVVGLNYHYSKSMDVYLRDTAFKIWTSLQPEELKNAHKMIPSARHRAVASRFQKYYALGAQGRDVRVVTGDKRRRAKTTVVYRYNNPFRIGMFSDNSGLRLFVYPDAKTLIGKCGVCDPSAALADPRKTLRFLFETVGRNNLAAGLKVMALRRWGIPIYRPGIRYAVTMLDRLARNGAIDENFLVAALKSFDSQKHMRRGYPSAVPVPASVRDGYLAATGVDGLRAVNATERHLDADGDAASAAAADGSK